MNIEGEDDLSLEAELEAALDASKPQEAPAEGETQEQAEERLYRREGRRFVAKEEEKAAAKEPAAKDAAPAPDGEQQQTPAEKPAKVWRPNWFKDEYGPWDTLPENFRNALRDQERAAAQGIEKHATSAKAWEPVLELLKPHEQELAAAGVNPQQYVSNLVNADKYLRADPVAAMNWLAQSYLGTDVIGLAQWMYDNNIQPQKVDPVKQELEQLRAQVQQLSQLPVQQQQQAVQRQISDWAKDKPDFDVVKPYMAAAAKQNPEASLDDLYREAQWAHPETRERLLKEIEDKRLAELKGKRQAGAQSPRGGQPNGAVRNQRPTMSLEDEIAMHLDGGV